MISSILFYIVILGLIIVLAYGVDKNGSRKKLISIVLILSLVSGLRASVVGIDTYSYYSIFEAVYNDDPTLAWRNIEPTFLYICKLLLHISTNPNFLLFLFALLANSLIILRLWDFKDVAPFPWMIACYYSSFYFLSMNIVRQFCAIAIIFFATRYLFERKYIVYMFALGLAYLFHRSALVGLLFFCVELIDWAQLNKKQKLFIFLGFATIPIYIGHIIANIQMYFKYFKSFSPNIGFMLPVKIVLAVFLGIGLKIIRNNDDNSMNNHEHNKADTMIVTYDNPGFINRIKGYYYVGLLLTFLGYFFSFMDRIGLPFYLYECVFVGVLVKYRSDRKICKMIYALLIAYVLFSEFRGNGQGVLPYVFFWKR
ncbi:MAG TPA: EpsG family protein [Ruminococcus sp.]|nr:EpsG family protein [Ruminococcus sp.]